MDKIYLDNCLRTGRLLKKRLHSCAGLCKLCILLVLVVQDFSGRADLQGSYKVSHQLITAKDITPPANATVPGWK